MGASTVVIRELSGTGEDRRRVGFGLLAVSLLVQSTWVMTDGFRPHHSPLGIGWTAVTAALMHAPVPHPPVPRWTTHC
ncbi:hypothetical protein AQJ11_28740 [Streptomyces corchorusii]|uniref:Uncharacterized protein n=2 Tax=Streptomyces TaxID=1883 RepID=A0A101PZZ8_STRCK|nr:hypothetical protein [Streptomyces corchorusii]KUN20813.1 hypothetical protein AQJ11_28740 [Streptomyces corchorusii]